MRYSNFYLLTARPGMLSLDFAPTNSPSELEVFTEFVRDIEAEGGEDECEDVHGGLEEMLHVSYTSQ